VAQASCLWSFVSLLPLYHQNHKKKPGTLWATASSA
jgi:hypothetical protein